MKNGDETLWTIDELGERVAEVLLGPGYEGVPSGRVRDVPDLRTIRYYTTLGLLDRPAAMQGRTALYGARHLLQLVAIKRLQARGLSLAEVQQRVIGLSNAALRRLAAVEVGAPDVSRAEPRSRRGEGEAPCEPATALGSHGGSPSRKAAERDARGVKAGTASPPAASASREESFWRVQAEVHEQAATEKSPGKEEITLEHGLVLSVAARRRLDDDDLRVIRMAAAPLIEILRLRGLIGLGR